jgi:hypothetical protein
MLKLSGIILGENEAGSIENTEANIHCHNQISKIDDSHMRLTFNVESSKGFQS